MTWLDDLEERLVRAGARGIGQQLADQVGRAFGRQEDRTRHGDGDVWDVATHEDERPAAEPPECAWCPLCRAIRLSQQAGPGLAGHMSGAADALATAAQDALGLVDEILSSAGRRNGPPAGPPPGPGAEPPGGAPGPGAEPPGSVSGPAAEPPGSAPGPGAQRPAPGEPGHPGDGPASRA